MSDLPEGAERVEVLHKSIDVKADPDEVPDGIEVRDLKYSNSDSVIAVFETGDEIPVEFAERCWSSFNDRLAAYDGEGNRLDEPSETEKSNFDTALFHHGP